MTNRRDFFRRAAEMSAMLMMSIEKAAAIEPDPNSTFEDAEHVVILMQENRSFDHMYGALRGVRGFNDPRAVTLPNGDSVWRQPSKAERKSYTPFRLDLRGSKITWLGSLPHSWRDQTDARNYGNHDGWLEAKPSGRKECAGMPLTMGYFDRRDLPFYYALADAFTICDQNFCSTLTGTTPNRLHLWTGKILDAKGQQNVRNSEVSYGSTANWTTYPERLEDAGISWRVYQNELSLDSGLSGPEDEWLANFTDNPLEWFDQYNVGFRPGYREHLQRSLSALPKLIEEAKAKPTSEQTARQIRGLEARLAHYRRELAKWTPEVEQRMSPRDRALHNKAYTTNSGDPNYRQLTTLKYRDEATGEEREMFMPKGDVLHQFRQDVNSGQLPKVSWLIPPENFSDHPGAPWYGAWYLAQTLNILTAKPEVWKNTIFILCYDENDGYFDHVPPFVVPDPAVSESGRMTTGLDAKAEFWSLEQDRLRASQNDARGGPIGLGYRVPLVIASPWSRGGFVNSEVCDHTSILRLLERITKVKEPNISAWRRAVCGDLSSVFRKAALQKPEAKLPFPEHDQFLKRIHQAQFKGLPAGWTSDGTIPKQEPGTRPSLPLPYQLAATAKVNKDGALHLRLQSGPKSGSPFHAYTQGLFRNSERLRTRAYAVEAGKTLEDTWDLAGFPNGKYDVHISGPNGFLRSFTGNAQDPKLNASLEYQGNSSAYIAIHNEAEDRGYEILIADRSYGTPSRTLRIEASQALRVPIQLAQSHHWYDLQLTVTDYSAYSRAFAGRVETGAVGISDPAMA